MKKLATQGPDELPEAATQPPVFQLKEDSLAGLNRFECAVSHVYEYSRTFHVREPQTTVCWAFS